VLQPQVLSGPSVVDGYRTTTFDAHKQLMHRFMSMVAASLAGRNIEYKEDPSDNERQAAFVFGECEATAVVIYDGQRAGSDSGNVCGSKEGGLGDHSMKQR
jgi:hypothetical protein